MKLTSAFHNPELPAPEMTILNVALNLVLRTPPQQVTATHIYKAAGVSKATLYQYFSGKADIWAGMLLEEERTRLQTLARMPEEPVITHWQEYFFSVLQYPEKLAALQTLEVMLREDPPEERRYERWRSLREAVLNRMVSARERAADLDNAVARHQVAIIWCGLEGWLRLYRDPEFSKLSGGRRQFAHQLSADFARRMVSS